MLENLSFRVPYPPPQEGFWGEPTSTLNWCEEDYVISHYAAEITNTLTNALFIALGVRGVRNCFKYKHDTVFVIAYLGYLSRLFSIALGIGLVVLSISITVYYHYIQDPTFHQNAFSILFLATVFRSLYTMEAILRPSLNNNYVNKSPGASLSDGEARSSVQRPQVIIREMRWIVTMGFITCAAGIAAWKFDNVHCSDLVRWRHQVGLPWGILLEGHGWWHLMTGLGVNYFITWGRPVSRIVSSRF
ncbi:hypothetical protein FVER53590_05725 [Fusarium verticillioides]|nr:hypothetical protein FVER53590_05725 [Fusarium verticillioides]